MVIQWQKTVNRAGPSAPPYFAALQLQKEVPGSEFSIVSANGGADRYAGIVRGHLDAGPEGTPPSENIRALVVLSPERHEAIPDVPCSREQEIPIYSENSNYWCAPKGTPTEIIDHLAAGFEKSLGNEIVKKRLGEIRIDPLFKKGEEFKEYPKQAESGFVGVGKKKELELPNFPKIAGAIVCLLFLRDLIDSFLKRNQTKLQNIEKGGSSSSLPKYGTAFFVALVLFGYVIALQSERIPFAIITAIMVFIIGSLISGWSRYHRLTLIK